MKLVRFKVAVGKHQPGDVDEVTDGRAATLLRLGYAESVESLASRLERIPAETAEILVEIQGEQEPLA